VVGSRAGVDTLGRHGGVAVPHRRSLDTRVLGEEQRLGAERRPDLVEGHLHPLTDTGPIPVRQGRQDRVRPEDPARRIGVEQRGPRDLAVGVAGDRGQRGGRLDVRPVGEPVAPWPVRPVPRHRQHDETGVHRRQGRPVEAEVPHHPSAVVLDEHVGGADEVEQHLAAVGHGEIDADVPLVAVHLGEVERAVVGLALEVLRRPRPVQRPGRRTFGPLDLDHIRTEVGEVAAAERSGPVLRDLDHPQPGERAGPACARTAARGATRRNGRRPHRRCGLRAHGGIVLADRRSPATALRSTRRETVRLAGEPQRGSVAVDRIGLPPGPEGELRVLEDPRRGHDRGDRDPQELAPLHDLGHRAVRRPAGDRVEDPWDVREPGRDVPGEILRREVRSFDEGEDRVVRDDPHQVEAAVGGVDQVAGDTLHHLPAPRPRGHQPRVCSEHGVELRHLDVLSTPRRPAFPEPDLGSEEGVRPRVQRRLSARQPQRLTVRRAGDAEVPAHRPDTQVRRRRPGPGAGASPRAHIHDDRPLRDPGGDRRRERVVVVDEEDVGVGEQSRQDRVVDPVDAHRAPTCGEVGEPQPGSRRTERRPGPERGAGSRFEEDHVGAEIGGQLRGEPRREPAATDDDTVADERAVHLGRPGGRPGIPRGPLHGEHATPRRCRPCPQRRVRTILRRRVRSRRGCSTRE